MKIFDIELTNVIWGDKIDATFGASRDKFNPLLIQGPAVTGLVIPFTVDKIDFVSVTDPDTGEVTIEVHPLLIALAAYDDEVIELVYREATDTEPEITYWGFIQMYEILEQKTGKVVNITFEGVT